MNFSNGGTILWRDHAPGCPKCREVDIEISRTFVNACAMGSRLLAEELKIRQAPAERERALAVKKWAEKAGVFKTESGVSKDKLAQIVRYVE